MLHNKFILVFSKYVTDEGRQRKIRPTHQLVALEIQIVPTGPDHSWQYTFVQCGPERLPASIQAKWIFIEHVLPILVPHRSIAGEFRLHVLKCLFQTPLIDFDGSVDLTHPGLSLIRTYLALAARKLREFNKILGVSP